MNSENFNLSAIIFTFFFAMTLSVLYWSFRNKISPMPTSGKVKNELFNLLHLLPPITKGKIYELGSGWGTLLIPLGEQYSKLSIIGFETSWIPYWFSKIRIWLRHSKNVKVKRKDFFIEALEEASLVVCYLYPAAMEKLKDQLIEKLKTGTWVISHTFAIPGWKPYCQVEADDLYKTKIYIYQF